MSFAGYEPNRNLPYTNRNPYPYRLQSRPYHTETDHLIFFVFFMRYQQQQ